jgi:hypothetical protein
MAGNRAGKGWTRRFVSAASRKSAPRELGAGSAQCLHFKPACS